MTGVLLSGAVRSIRRGWVVWTVSIAALIALTTAFWPAFKDSGGMTDAIAGMSPGLVEALGIGDLNSPEGFLWGNLYALLVPLLMAVAGTSFLTTLTARQEDSGQYELILTQPVSRTAALLAGSSPPSGPSSCWAWRCCSSSSAPTRSGISTRPCHG
ncbi:hypothetical protein ACFQX7_26390 [Luedemannella flava]